MTSCTLSMGNFEGLKFIPRRSIASCLRRGMLKFSAIKGQGNSRFGQRGRLEPTTPGNWGCVHVVSVLFAYFGLVSPLSLWGIVKMIARLQLAHQGIQNLRLEALNVDRFTPRTIDQATKFGAYLSAYERQRLKTLFSPCWGMTSLRCINLRH